jgi:hypothetical protein
VIQELVRAVEEQMHKFEKNGVEMTILPRVITQTMGLNRVANGAQVL